jgi:hypothetical protein
MKKPVVFFFVPSKSFTSMLDRFTPPFTPNFRSWAWAGVAAMQHATRISKLKIFFINVSMVKFVLIMTYNVLDSAQK